MHTDTNKVAILLIGAGGHGKVVLDALLSMGISTQQISVYDANKQKLEKTLLDLPVNFEDPQTIVPGRKFHIAIGNGLIRERISSKLLALGGFLFSIIHPRAVISSYANIADGVFVAANSIVAPNANVGAGTILNHGCVIDHDCSVGRYSHVAPLASLSGGVVIGDRVLIGARSNILPGIHIGSDAVIGAGAVVTKDVVPNGVVVGIPAKPVE